MSPVIIRLCIIAIAVLLLVTDAAPFDGIGRAELPIYARDTDSSSCCVKLWSWFLAFLAVIWAIPRYIGCWFKRHRRALFWCMVFLGSTAGILYGCIWTATLRPMQYNKWPCHRIMGLPSNFSDQIQEFSMKNAIGHKNTFYFRSQETLENWWRFHQPRDKDYCRIDALIDQLKPAYSPSGNSISWLHWNRNHPDNMWLRLPQNQTYLNITTLTTYINKQAGEAQVFVNDDDWEYIFKINNFGYHSHRTVWLPDGVIVEQFTRAIPKKYRICIIQNPEQPLQDRLQRIFAYAVAAQHFDHAPLEHGE